MSPWIHTLDASPVGLKYRCHWTPPLAIDPFDHNTVYYGCQVVFKTSNEGQSWSVISPDLSTQDSSKIIPSGGIAQDNLGQFYGEVVFAIAPSSIQRGLIWAGTNGYLDVLPLNKVRPFEDGLLSLLRGKNTDILNAIRDSRDLSDDTAAKLKSVVEGYAKSFA